MEDIKPQVDSSDINKSDPVVETPQMTDTSSSSSNPLDNLADTPETGMNDTCESNVKSDLDTIEKQTDDHSEILQNADDMDLLIPMDKVDTTNTVENDIGETINFDTVSNGTTPDEHFHSETTSVVSSQALESTDSRNDSTENTGANTVANSEVDGLDTQNDDMDSSRQDSEDTEKSEVPDNPDSGLEMEANETDPEPKLIETNQTDNQRSSDVILHGNREPTSLVSGYRSDGSSDTYDSSSDSESSSSTSSESDFMERETRAAKAIERMVAGDDDLADDEEHPIKGRPRTRGELFPEDLLPIEDLCITVDEDTPLVPLGTVSSIVGILVVVKSQPDTAPLDSDSVIFTSDRKSLGTVFETFGPVKAPFYSIRFNSADDIKSKGVEIGMDVFCAPSVPDYTHYVFMKDLYQNKGSDASWKENNEPPPQFLDYSDDEEERKANKAKSQRNRKRNRHGNVNEHNADNEQWPPQNTQPDPSCSNFRGAPRPPFRPRGPNPFGGRGWGAPPGMGPRPDWVMPPGMPNPFMNRIPGPRFGGAPQFRPGMFNPSVPWLQRPPVAPPHTRQPGPPTGAFPLRPRPVAARTVAPSGNSAFKPIQIQEPGSDICTQWPPPSPNPYLASQSDRDGEMVYSSQTEYWAQYK